MDPLEELIAAAHGEIEVDLLLEGADIVNTLSGEVYRSDVAVHRDRVVGFDPSSAKKTMDLSGLVLAPGFMDGHVHLESAMVTPPEYARAVVPRGTTSVIADPHEIANVLGPDGIRYILNSSENIPLNVYLMLPSCVPATHLETSGADLSAADLLEFIDHPRILGLAEVMNYPGVIFRDGSVLEKIRLARGKGVDGHAPGLTGRDLAAYVSAGIKSDHECTSAEGARERLRFGMHIMMREGTAAKNLGDLIPIITPLNARQFLLVSDDRHASDILREGHIDFMVRRAVDLGLDPILALQMASLNAAQYFGIPDLGAIAPGFRADIVALDDLDHIDVRKVFKDGKLAAEDGHLLLRLKKAPAPKAHSMRVGRIEAKSLEVKAKSELVRVIEVVQDQIITRSQVVRARVVGGKIEADTERDILRMAVIERHKATGNIGLGLVKGFGLQSGAIATTVAHDSHNLAVVGVTTRDMLAAALAVVEMGGGMTVTKDGAVKARLPLPVAGLLSDKDMREVEEGINRVSRAAHDLGCSLKDPFMTLSFLCLPVIPELKLTDKGLVDVGKFNFVPLFAEEPESP